MAIRNIVTIPNEVLTKKTEKIRDFNEDLKKLSNDLIDTVRSADEPEGAGIAATQIGVSKRICVVRDFFEDPSKQGSIIAEDYVLVNPKIVSKSKDTELDWEGCLSVPDSYGKVERYKKVKVEYQDLEGNRMRIKANGFFARVIQHEIDHLDGILFTERVQGDLLTEKEFEEYYDKSY